MSKVLECIKNNNGVVVAYAVNCPGCEHLHVVYITGRVKWSFNGNVNKPSFSPSLLVNADLTNPTSPRCHSFIRDGKWQFLNDCTHHLKGKTADMVSISDKDWD